MNKQGTEIFIREFDAVMHSSIKVGERNYTYKSLISKEVHNLSEYIKYRDKGYNPFIMMW